MIFQRLQDWQDHKGRTDASLAEEVGCTRTVLNRAKRGLHALKMKHQLKLEEITGISPAEWAQFYARVEAAKPPPSPKKKQDPAVRSAA